MVAGQGGRVLTSVSCVMYVSARACVLAVRNGARAMSGSGAGAYLVEELPFLQKLGLQRRNPGVYDGTWASSGQIIKSVSPASGRVIAEVQAASAEDYARAADAAAAAWPAWRQVPAPARGEIVRDIGTALRDNLEPLAQLVALEMGKILSEARGEVVEYIHVCELATGLSRTLPGLVLPSERAGNALLELWHPLGPVGVISAFNFPVAVYGWNSAIAMTCGDTLVWKPAESTPLCAVAVTRLVADVLQRHGAPGAVAALCVGGADVGRQLVADERLPLISFTGSTQVGQQVGVEVQKRFGRHILELGGNNAIVVNADADLDLVLAGALFACVGTAGQRCTTTRRLLVHQQVYEEVLSRLKRTYASIESRIGDPLHPDTLVGPLHTPRAVQLYRDTVAEAVRQGGTVEYGGNVLQREGNFVQPTIISGLPHDSALVQSERFVPIVYVLAVPDLDTAILYNNSVDQGLSSSLFTEDISDMFKWIGASGSDCGIVNVNIGTSGAEVGGAFGGNKHTGGGRECGSDAWKAYMRRATVTINYSKHIQLAQNIHFKP